MDIYMYIFIYKYLFIHRFTGLLQQDSELHKAEKDFDLLTPRSIIQ